MPHWSVLFLIMKSQNQAYEYEYLFIYRLLMMNPVACRRPMRSRFKKIPMFLSTKKKIIIIIKFSEVDCSFSENTSATFDTVGRLHYSHGMKILH